LLYRMSLSHPDRREKHFREFHLSVMFEGCTSGARPAPTRRLPARRGSARTLPAGRTAATFRCLQRLINMRWMLWLEIAVLSACGSAQAQTPAAPSAQPGPGSAPAAGVVPVNPDLSSAILQWAPPALAQLSAQAVAKESFTLDRAMLAAAAGLVPDSDADVRQAVAKLDGVSVHVLRFGDPAAIDVAQVDAIRQAYHLRGWKHVVSSTSVGGAVHNQTTDVWLVLDGANVRGAVVLVESPRSLTLATVAGNLSPVDLLHLRGHFGIPRFEGDGLNDAGEK